MSKVFIENKKGRIVVTNKLSSPETINERVYNALASGMFEGFLPVSIVQSRKETIVECTVCGLIPLDQYFSGIVTKKMFLDFVRDIAGLIKNCEKNMVNANNIDLECDKIFVDPQTKKVKCIFWPIVNNQREKQPQVFLKQLPHRLNFNPHENNDYLDTYIEFFDGYSPFSVNSYERMILRVSGSASGYLAPSRGLSGTLTRNVDIFKKEPQTDKKVSVEYDPFAQGVELPPKENIQIEKSIVKDNGFVFCATCGTKNTVESRFCIMCGKRLFAQVEVHEDNIKDNADDSGTTVLGDDFGGTTVLGYDEPEEPIFPVLIRTRTDESFVINKPSFRIGTEQKYCDLFISDNNYISRSHADILTRDNRYYIIDRNSTNKTYIDGKVIAVESEVEIFSGTQIRLANEDFTFNVES